VRARTYAHRHLFANSLYRKSNIDYFLEFIGTLLNSNTECRVTQLGQVISQIWQQIEKKILKEKVEW